MHQCKSRDTSSDKVSRSSLKFPILPIFSLPKEDTLHIVLTWLEERLKQNEMKGVNGKNCNANAENSVTLEGILIWFFLKLQFYWLLLFSPKKLIDIGC